MRNLVNISLLLLTVSCTAPMEVNVRPEEARLVIYSILLDDAVRQQVSVQRSVPYFSGENANWVDDAAVTISVNGKSYATSWSEVDKAYRTTETFSTAPGETYSLDVEYDFDQDGTREHYTASTTILDQPPVLERIEVVPFTMPMLTAPMYELRMFGQDPPGRNFFVMRIEVNGVRYNRLEDMMTVGDRMFQNGKIDGFPLSVFPGEADEENPDRIWFKPGDNISIRLSNVDANLMRFIAEVQSSGSGENPLFGGPPHNVRTNISGGGGRALGFFGSIYAARQYETVVPE